MKDETETILTCPPAKESDRVAIGIVGYQPTPNALEGKCQRCGMAIHIGVKQQAHMKANATAKAYCFLCTVKTSGGSPVTSLGGTGGTYVTDFSRVKPK